MNKDQIRGKARTFGGRIQEAAGKLLGSKWLQLKGLKKQVSGRVQLHVGNLKQAMKHASR